MMLRAPEKTYTGRPDASAGNLDEVGHATRLN